MLRERRRGDYAIYEEIHKTWRRHQMECPLWPRREWDPLNPNRNRNQQRPT